MQKGNGLVRFAGAVRLYLKKPQGLILAAAILIIAGITACFGATKIFAAEDSTISVQDINYEDSTITLRVNPGDTMVYFSDYKKKTWELVPGDISSSRTITMDISWITQTSNYIITFKADTSTGVLSVKLPKKATNFKAAYNKIKGTLTFTNQNDRVVEWRKKNSTYWNILNPNTIENELESMCVLGGSIYVRLAAVRGTSATDTGMRPSKEISVTIPKKTTAPSLKLNGSTFSIVVSSNMAYRTVNSNGTYSDWTSVKSGKTLLLWDIAAAAMYKDGSTAQKKVELQFKKVATSSSPASHLTTISVPVQEGPPDAAANGIELTYTSSTVMSLQVKAASAACPFEYTIVEKDDKLDYQSAKWAALSSTAAVTISSKTAPEGSRIYVRKKLVEASDTVEYKMASKETDITGGGVKFPSSAEATGLTTLITTAGVCNPENTSGNLTFDIFSPTKTTISSLSFLDQYGNSKGTATISSTVVKNSASIGDKDRYKITTKITSTETLSQATDLLLYGEMTLANGDKIRSTTGAGVQLYVYPKSKLNNTKNKEYKSAFERVLFSTETKDDKSFTFQLDLGKSKVPDYLTPNGDTGVDTQISSIKYDGYTLVENTDYTVTYGTYLNDDEKNIRFATVTIHTDKFENNRIITVRDKAEPIKITLNNKEILDDIVTINLVNTAVLKDAPIAWAITEGSLKETETKTITNEDKTTTTVTEEVISYKLELTIFKSSYAVGVLDVTWGGSSILGSANVSGGKMTISLSNAKINKLTTDRSTSDKVKITLSNGYVIDSGCILTILDSGK